MEDMEYQIGDFATISRLSVKTLRYYHEIGLLVPSRIERSSGYRYYDAGCLARVQSIQHLKALNFSLAEMQEILSAGTDPDAIQNKMALKLTEVEQQITHFEQVRSRLQSYLTRAALPIPLPNPIQEVTLPDQLIASIRFTGLYQELNLHIPRLMQACGRLVLGPPFSLYYDDHPMSDGMDIEICVPVLQPVENAPVHSGHLPGGRALSILHEGPYEQISISYQAMVDYLRAHEFTPLYPSREIYWKGGGESTQDSQDYRTEIQFMLA